VHFVTSVIENNEVAQADHEAILDVLQKQAAEQQAPAKEAASIEVTSPRDLVAREALP